MKSTFHNGKHISKCEKPNKTHNRKRQLLWNMDFTTDFTICKTCFTTDFRIGKTTISKLWKALFTMASTFCQSERLPKLFFVTSPLFSAAEGRLGDTVIWWLGGRGAGSVVRIAGDGIIGLSRSQRNCRPTEQRKAIPSPTPFLNLAVLELAFYRNCLCRIWAEVSEVIQKLLQP